MLGSEGESTMPVVRKRILPLLDSDSDCDMTNKVDANAVNASSKKLVNEKEQQVNQLHKLYPKMTSYVSVAPKAVICNCASLFNCK